MQMIPMSWQGWQRRFMGLLLWVILVWSGWGISPAIAAPISNPIAQPLIPVEVSLSNEAGALKFFPDTLEFTAGKRYQLVLTNPSPQKHYFTAKDFADAIWSQKVEAGKVEIKGAIHDLELKPGATADWVFIPQKPGRYTLRCTIPGHTEAGMTGTITVTAP